MQDDLTDAVRYVVDRGYADPQRIAIVGASYGGYAALAGVTFTPELFRCAVSMSGPSNLISYIESIPPYWKAHAARLRQRIGDPAEERDFLWSRSPLSRIENVRAPVLIAQGANDPRVPASESEQMVAALRKHGVDHEYVLFPDEGHGVSNPRNRLAFYAKIEAFLAHHVGGRCEP
jgi:dipeptidyl aminopeptidase/acylaminoacyl peptidase